MHSWKAFPTYPITSFWRQICSLEGLLQLTEVTDQVHSGRDYPMIISPKDIYMTLTVPGRYPLVSIDILV